MSGVIVAALYKFVTLEDFHELREPLLDACREAETCGTLLLAREGINGTIAGSRAGIDRVLAYLRSDPRLADLEHKESVDESMPFYRMKVKLKKEIVTMGVPGIDPNEAVGTYVSPGDWNELLSDPEVLLIDTRNDYEYGIGSFRASFRSLCVLISTRASRKRSRCSAPVAFAARRPPPSCSRRVSRRFITCRAVS